MATRNDVHAGIRALTKKLGKKVPRHQHKGPIVAGPTTLAVCPFCTQLFFTSLGKEGLYGVPRRLMKAHTRAHREGRIRAPQEALS